jgi:hypothetical protein
MNDDTQPPTDDAKEIDGGEDLEVSAEESEAIKGGEVTFEYGALQVKYTQQQPSGHP